MSQIYLMITLAAEGTGELESRVRVAIDRAVTERGGERARLDRRRGNERVAKLGGAVRISRVPTIQATPCVEVRLTIGHADSPGPDPPSSGLLPPGRGPSGSSGRGH